MNVLTSPPTPAYAHRAVTLLADGLDRSNQLSRRTSATKSVGAFFMSAGLYGGFAWDTFGCAEFLDSRSVNPRKVTTHNRLTAVCGDSNNLGVSLMSNITQGASAPATPSQNLAAAYRSMAIAALRADSSASVRLARYNAHMSKARALEAVGVRHD